MDRMIEQHKQDIFDLCIGQLDRVISKLVNYSRRAAESKMANSPLDEADRQTLKHHAEDMILAGNKILKDLQKGMQPFGLDNGVTTLKDRNKRLEKAIFYACAGVVSTPEKPSEDPEWIWDGLKQLRIKAEIPKTRTAHEKTFP